MKQKELFPILINQELINTYYLYKKDIKKIEKRMFKNKIDMHKYSKIILRIPSYIECDGSINFILFKKISICKSLVKLCIESDEQLDEFLYSRIEWINSFEEYIQNIELKSQNRNYLYAL